MFERRANLKGCYMYYLKHTKILTHTHICVLPWGLSGKKKKFLLPKNAGDVGLTLGSGRSPGERNGNPFQYSCLENPMDGGA